MKWKYLIIIFLCCIKFTQGQKYFLSEFENSHNASVFKNNLKLLDDGSFITQEYFHNLYDTNKLFLTKFDARHQLVWSKIITNFNNVRRIGWGDHFNYKLKVASPQTYYLVTLHSFSNNAFVLVNKLDGKGSIVWSRRIEFNSSKIRSDSDFRLSLTLGFNNTPLVVLSHNNDNYSKFLMAKISSNGLIQWMKQSQGLEVIDCAKRESFGFILLVSNTSNQEKQLLWIDNNGTPKKRKAYKKSWLPNLRNEFLKFVRATKNGVIYVAGGVDFPNSSKRSAVLMKLDSSGNPVWYRYYTRSLQNTSIRASGLRITSNNQPLMLISPYTTRDKVFYMVKHRSNGNLIWQSTFSSLHEGNLYPGRNKLHITQDSGYCFMGFNNTNIKPTMIKFNKNGFNQCIGVSSNLSVDSLFQFVDSSLAIPTFNDTVNIRKDTSLLLRNSTNQETIICSKQPIPKVRLNDTILCNTNSHTLKIDKDSSHFDLQWSTGDTTNSITIDSSGTYWASSSYDTITVTDTAHITFLSDIKTGLPDDTSFCPYDSVKLTIQHPANANFTWVTPEKDSTGNNIEEQGKAIWAQDTGSYYLKVQEATHCEPVDTIHLNHHPLPSANAGPDTTLCYNQTYTMQGKGGITYQWIPARYLSNDSVAKPKAELPNQQRYKLIVSNQHGCNDTSEVLINVRDSLKVALSPNDRFVCKGTPVKLNANPAGGYSPNYQFNWRSYTTSTPSIEVAPAQSGWHRVTLKDYCSQPAKDSIYIEVAQPPMADFTTSPQDTAFTNQEIRFFNQSTNAARYNWNFGKPGLNSSRKNPVHGYQDSGTYPIKLQAFGQADCGTDANLDTLHVIDTTRQFKVYIPDAFSPNHDGTNDEWKIKGVGIQAIQFDIYNRWGRQVFSANNQRTWDGRFRKSDQKVREGVYLYLLKITDPLGNPHYYSGEIHVIQ
ncbi:MAG: hypothetical protein BRD49_05160 [Bacteroidetes bacterium SW_10_40_5]|nr:MAG: hypothetical protein BRD49_05160 [Bacteroidetes bacterium SW_10_40_5]